MRRLAGKEVRQRRKLHGAVFKIIILMINSNIAGARLGLSHVVTGSGVCAKIMECMLYQCFSSSSRIENNYDYIIILLMSF